MVGAGHPLRRQATIGVGLRGPHVDEVIATRPAIGWFEIHAENYMGGGVKVAQLDRIRRDYPLSLHGVGLSLGSADGVDAAHLARLKALIARMDPMLVSEHLAWCAAGGAYLSDLLPLPYTEECLELVVRNVGAAQDALGRPLLIENPSVYLRFRHSPIPEPEFLAELVRRSGCGLLCDVNNIYVSCANLGLDAAAYLEALPAAAVGEIHLAGFASVRRDGRSVLIDDHGAPVAPPVWDLYRAALARCGPIPSLVEWDKQLPPLASLLREAGRAAAVAAAATSAADAAAR